MCLFKVPAADETLIPLTVRSLLTICFSLPILKIKGHIFASIKQPSAVLSILNFNVLPLQSLRNPTFPMVNQSASLRHASAQQVIHAFTVGQMVQQEEHRCIDMVFFCGHLPSGQSSNQTLTSSCSTL